MMLIAIIPKEQEGVDRCLRLCTKARLVSGRGRTQETTCRQIWTGFKFNQEIDDLEENGIMYSESTRRARCSESLLPTGMRLTFWRAADMAAQCSVLGHGCAGDKFAGTHRSADA